VYKKRNYFCNILKKLKFLQTFRKKF